MKRITNLLLAVMAMLSATAQPNLFTKTTPGFSKAIETVLGDFPYNYKHITGELVEKEGDHERFASTVNLPGAKSCLVGFYHSEFDTTASWQALMFRGEEFEKAAREYKRLYNQLNRCKLKMVDGSEYYLGGNYEAASEALDFVVSELKIQTADERYRNFKVELEMLYELDEWLVHINIVTRKPDNEMKPDWMADQ
jgi:hypothetical protein